MSLGHGSKIVTNGLVYHMDPANKKCFASSDIEAEYLIVAGGGGGGSGHTASSLGGGGGGAGGLIRGILTSVSGTNTIVVGAGGSGADGPAANSTGGIDTKTQYPNLAGNNGSDSTAFGLTAIGGGGGATRNAHENGKDGGSGGGACGTGISTGGTGVIGQGNDGGSKLGGEWIACGGGGYLEAGQSSSATYLSTEGGDGGFSHLVSRYFAGGGGGGGQNTATSKTGGTGGIGGGADGGTHPSDAIATSGQPNTGGGGGGAIAWAGAGVDSNGGNGGSGIVIIRYKGPQKATGGDQVYESNGHTIHIFNNSGSFVVGSVTGDLSNNGTLSTLNNGISFTSDNAGGFAFDGVDDDITVNGLTLNPTGFSISCFIKIPTAGNFNKSILSGGNTSTSGFWFMKHREGLGGRLVFHGWDGVNPRIDTQTSVVLPDNIPCHVGVTYDGVAYRLYINGVQNGPDFIDNSISNAAITSLMIGQGAGSRTNGNIYNVMVYDRPLSSNEVLQNFAATRGRYGV